MVGLREWVLTGHILSTCWLQLQGSVLEEGTASDLTKFSRNKCKVLPLGSRRTSVGPLGWTNWVQLCGKCWGLASSALNISRQHVPAVTEDYSILGFVNRSRARKVEGSDYSLLGTFEAASRYCIEFWASGTGKASLNWSEFSKGPPRWSLQMMSLWPLCPVLSATSVLPGPCYSLAVPHRTHSLGSGMYFSWVLVENKSAFINLLLIFL